MVSKISKAWHASMAEPIVLCAGLNYLADSNSDALMDYFAAQLFLPVRVPYATAQERGHVMECVIALRFLQGWWLESNLRKRLPGWVNQLCIPKPLGVMDCRSKDPGVNLFLQQLRNDRFPWIVFPSVNAGPDIRYSVFSCHVKTSWTIFVDPAECRKNLETMIPGDWYKSQKSAQKGCSSEVSNMKFLHLRFELPYTAPSMKDAFANSADEEIICVDLNTEFAADFFGAKFVQKYRDFLTNLASN